MGHTYGEWQSHVSELVRDATFKDLTATQVMNVGVVPALTQFSVDQPRIVYADLTAAGTPYFDLPAAWATGFSDIRAIESPIGSNPPRYLDAQSWQRVRKTSDLAVEQILLDRTPPAGQSVRLAFTTPWPTPDSDVDTDDLAVAFEAVCALAASLCCVSLAAQSSRDRSTGMPSDWVEGRNRSQTLLSEAERLRGLYDSYLGLGQTGIDDTAPASGSFDFDPSYYSVFHGGRQ